MLVCRKSRVSSRSSFPSGACSCQATSTGRLPSGASVARSEESVPSRCLRKYSLPLPEEPSRLARQIDRIRGKFSGASGSSPAKSQVPRLQLLDDVLPDRPAGRGRVVAEVERVAVEGRVGRHPAHPGALRDHVGGGLAGEPALAGGRRQRVRAELVVAELVGVEVPVRGLDHVARRPVPVQRVGDLGVAGDRADLLLADVVRPAAAVDALAAGERGQGQERAVDRVGVEPVVGARAHHDHRAARGSPRRSAANSRPIRAAAAARGRR